MFQNLSSPRRSSKPRPVPFARDGRAQFFNVHAEGIAQVNRRIQDACLSGGAIATLGNVEVALASPSFTGCGCDYPPYVDTAVVARADAVVRALHDAMWRHDGVLVPGMSRVQHWLAGLPRYARITVGERTVLVLHGDARDLAGWDLAVEAMLPADERLPWVHAAKLSGGQAVPLS